MPLYFCLSLCQMLTDFQSSLTDIWVLSNKFMATNLIKYPTTPQTHHWTSLWNVCAQKSLCPRDEWSELPHKTQPFKIVAQKYSSNDVGIICVHRQKHVYSEHTEKPAEWPIVHTSIKQEERRHIKTPMHTINVQSLMTSVGKSQVADQFDTCRSWSPG